MSVNRMIEEIKQLVNECEEYQESTASKYQKEQEKVIVYDKIVEILKGGDKDGASIDKLS